MENNNLKNNSLKPAKKTNKLLVALFTFGSIVLLGTTASLTASVANQPISSKEQKRSQISVDSQKSSKANLPKAPEPAGKTTAENEFEEQQPLAPADEDLTQASKIDRLEDKLDRFIQKSGDWWAENFNKAITSTKSGFFATITQHARDEITNAREIIKSNTNAIDSLKQALSAIQAKLKNQIDSVFLEELFRKTLHYIELSKLKSALVKLNQAIQVKFQKINAENEFKKLALQYEENTRKSERSEQAHQIAKIKATLADLKSKILLFETSKERAAMLPEVNFQVQSPFEATLQNPVQIKILAEKLQKHLKIIDVIKKAIKDDKVVNYLIKSLIASEANKLLKAQALTLPREYVQLSNRQKLNHRKIARLNDNLHAKTKRIEQLETDVDNLIIVLNRMTMKLSRLKEKGLQAKTTQKGKQKWSVWDKKMNELNQKFDRYSADYAKLATIMVFNKADQSALEDLTERVNALHRNIVTLRARLDKQSQTEKK